MVLVKVYKVTHPLTLISVSFLLPKDMHFIRSAMLPSKKMGKEKRKVEGGESVKGKGKGGRGANGGRNCCRVGGVYLRLKLNMQRKGADKN